MSLIKVEIKSPSCSSNALTNSQSQTLNPTNLNTSFHGNKQDYSHHAEARCYPKKRCLGFDFRFKKFRIKQAIFISDIYPFRVKASKQKKI